MTSRIPAERTFGAVLKSLVPGPFTTLTKIREGGALQARRLKAGGVQFYWRRTHEGKTDRFPIGFYDALAPPKSLSATERGFSVAAAEDACRRMAKIHADHARIGGYREYLQAQSRAHHATRTKKHEADQQTLSKLLDAYTEHLMREGRRAYIDARSIFRLHVTNAWPDVANSAASSVTVEQITTMLSALKDAGKRRTLNKLRSYMRAAYECALGAAGNPDTQSEFARFEITSNPAALTKKSAGGDRAARKPLSLKDLRAYWKLIKDVPGVKGAALRLHLLSGGQRMEQLTKLKNEDIATEFFTIHDGKGRPRDGARAHAVPRTPAISAAIKVLSTDNKGDYLISSDKGKTALTATTLSKWAKAIVGSEIDAFQLKRVRSAVETELAGAGVSTEVRGRLLSHGISGVQNTSYNAYDYLPEKRAALQILFDLLNSEKATEIDAESSGKDSEPEVTSSP